MSTEPGKIRWLRSMDELDPTGEFREASARLAAATNKLVEEIIWREMLGTPGAFHGEHWHTLSALVDGKVYRYRCPFSDHPYGCYLAGPEAP